MILPDVAPVAASDIVAMLERHYLPDGRVPGGVFAAEIESPDGRRRADAVWAPWSIADGSRLVGHEVKVSRSDVLNELADPMKAEPWARFCTNWFLVVAHPSMLDGLTVPDAWGIMAPPSGRRTRTMTVIRPAPQLKPADTGPAWRKIASWEHYRLTRRIQELEYAASRAQSDADYARRELAERQLAGEGRASRHAVKVSEIVTKLERDGWRGSEVELDDIVAALLDLASIRGIQRSARHELEYLVGEARRIAAPMGDVARQLEKLKAGARDGD